MKFLSKFTVIYTSVPNKVSPFCDVNITYIFLLNSGPTLRAVARGPAALLI